MSDTATSETFAIDMNIDMSGAVSVTKEGENMDKETASSPEEEIPQSRKASIAWDKDKKGYLTDSERYAKEADKDGKGYLSRDEAHEFASRFKHLSQQNQKTRKMLLWLVVLVCCLAVGTVAATIVAIQQSKEVVIDENGSLTAADSGEYVNVKAQGIKLFTYNTQDGSKICLSASDLAIAWTENENGGTVALIVETPDGNESVNRLTQTNAKMTTDVVSFGDNMEFYPDADCGNGASAENAHRSLKKHVQALRDGYFILPSSTHPQHDRKLDATIGGYSMSCADCLCR